MQMNRKGFFFQGTHTLTWAATKPCGMQTFPKEQPQPRARYLNMTVVLTPGWAAWRWDCKVSSACPRHSRGKSNFAPANSSNAGKILPTGLSIVICTANRNCSVLAQSREVTKCRENRVHLQTDACYQQHESVLSSTQEWSWIFSSK